MKNAIDWIKSNPIATACAVVSLVGIVLIAYFYVMAAPKYSAAKSEELKQQLQRQTSLQNIAVPLPNEDPNAPPDMHSVVVNQTVINEVGAIYREIQTQYEDILVNAKSKNNRNHIQVLLGRGNIWPDASPSQFFDLYVRAATDYKDHFKAVFDARRPNNWNMPRMVASSPPTQAELEMILAQSAFDFISSVGAQSAGDLTQNQANQLYAEQRMKLMEALNDRARSIHIYAQLPREEDIFAPKELEPGTTSPATAPAPAFPFGGGGSPAADQPNAAPPEYPFNIAAWAFSDQPPTPDQLWEGQVQVWVLRDIMATIANFNRVGRNDIKAIGPDGSIREEPASVINSPIKRLLKLQTITGYVGLHTTGAALGGITSSEFDVAAPTDFIETPGLAATPGIPGQPGTAAAQSIYPTPPAALAPKQETDRAIEHFGITPTGRVSNSVFDVRHTQLVIDIEAVKLPEFIKALQQTNFMTVIKAEITDLDEYELLQEGYVYGHADVIRADLVVESLWFRNWTKDLMPKIVKEKLLIIQPAVDPFAQPVTDF